MPTLPADERANAVSKKVKRRRRRSRARSTESLLLMRVFETSAKQLRRGLLVESLFSPSRSSLRPTQNHLSPRRGLGSRGLGSWAETLDLEKILFGVRAVAAVGGPHAIAFSLNLSPA